MIVKQIIVHHTASSRDNTTLSDIDAWHKLRWPDFVSSLGHWAGYHYVVEGNGKITQTRRDNEIGAHAIPNDGRLGICLTGNFETEQPSPAQLTSLGLLLDELKKTYSLTDEQVKGHREVTPTLCPGKNLYNWLKLYRQISVLKKLIEAIKKLLGLK